MVEQQTNSPRTKPPSPYWWLIIFPLGIISLISSGMLNSLWPMGLGLLIFLGLCLFMSPKIFSLQRGLNTSSPYRLLLIFPIAGIAGTASAAFDATWPMIVGGLLVAGIILKKDATNKK